MAVSQRDDSPISELVQAIVDEPLEMARRLDFADLLERRGCLKRARWIRACCSFWEAIYPLSMGLGITGTAISTPIGGLDLSSTLVHKTWEKIRPDYWVEMEGVIQTPYFGRVVFASRADVEGAILRIRNSRWLPQAYHEGWLESIWHFPANAGQLGVLAALPEAHRVLPLHIDLSCCWPTGVDNGMLRDVLGLEGLHGLTLCPSVFRYSPVMRFAETASNVVYLQLLGLKSTGTSVRILEQLERLTRLRSLVVGRNLPDDSSVAFLTRIPHLHTLRLHADKISDAGLLELTHLRSLRVLAVDSAKVSRAGIYALRKARPDMQVMVEHSTRDRIGPV